MHLFTMVYLFSNGSVDSSQVLTCNVVQTLSTLSVPLVLLTKMMKCFHVGRCLLKVT